MKGRKTAIFTLIACCLAVVVLMGVLFIGLNTGGIKVSHEPEGSSSAQGLSPEETYGNENRYTVDTEEHRVDSIKVSWANGIVEVRPGSGKEVIITESASRELAEDERMAVNVSGGELEIKWSAKIWDKIINLNFLENDEKLLTVEIPAELLTTIEEIEVEATSADIVLEDLTAREEIKGTSTSGRVEITGAAAESVSASSTSGNIEIKEVTATEELDINTTSGSVKIDGAVTGDLETDSVSGEVNAENVQAREVSASSVSGGVYVALTNCPEESEMSSVSGELTLVLPRGSGFQAKYSSLSGEFSSDFEISGGNGTKGDALSGDGKAKLSFSTTSGDMRVSMG